MNTRGLRFPIFLGVLATSAAAVAAAALVVYPPPIGVELLVLCAVTAGAEFYSVTFPSGAGASLSYPLSIAALVLLGPGGGALAAALSLVASIRERGEGFWHKILFNVSQITLCAALSGWVYLLLGGRSLLEQEGRVLLKHPLAAADFPGIVFPFAAMIMVSILLNYLFVTMYVVLRRNQRARQFWKSTFSWMTPTQVALGVLGLAIAQIVAVVGVPGLALFVAPLLVARETYNRYGRLRVAYADTVRSLVGAIEAKDPYTKGHSVRVSEYASRIAERLDMDEQQVERIVRAALLHDVGKIGVSRAVLAKPGALTSDEYEQVCRHPDIGASIIETVPYLRDIVPIVQYHHERMDGTGYGEGLRGGDIPLAARILAVADAFDAMTSARPYRSAMGESEALRELHAGAGTQFDSVVVGAMDSCMRARQMGEWTPAEQAVPDV